MAPIQLRILTSSCGSSLKRYTFLSPFITKDGTPRTYSTDATQVAAALGEMAGPLDEVVGRRAARAYAADELIEP